ncbi:MAG: signal peptidase II [Pirellulaceae bacterium]
MSNPTKSKTNVILFFLIAAIVLCLDLGTKSWVFANYYDTHADYQAPRYWIDGVFGIQPSTNPGALFGMGAGYHLWFAAISIVFLMFILVWLFRFGGASSRFLSIAMGAISGGILGNFYDRVGLGATPGHPNEIANHVRDWIYFRWEGISILDPWPNFNIADTGLVCGAILLFIHGMFFNPVPQKDDNKQELADHGS